jgi:hypothetical protein
MARARHRSRAEWVRQAQERARRHEPLGTVEKKLEAIRSAARHESPTADIDTMLEEIERGYSAGQHP